MGIQNTTLSTSYCCQDMCIYICIYIYVKIYIHIYMLCIYICVCVRCSKKICRTYAHKSLKPQDLYKQNMVRSWKFPRSLHEASTCVEWLVSIFPNCTSYLNYTTRQYIYVYIYIQNSTMFPYAPTHTHIYIYIYMIIYVYVYV